MNRKILSLLLAIGIMLSMIPMEVYADGMKSLGHGIGEMVQYIASGEGGTVTEAVYEIKITEQPVKELKAVYDSDVSTIGEISVEASATNGAEIKYQWVKVYDWGEWRNPEGSESSFSVPVDLPGTYKYYCILTAEGCDPVESSRTTVTIEKEDYNGKTIDKVYVKTKEATTGNVYILPNLPGSDMAYEVLGAGTNLISGTPTVVYDTSDDFDWKWKLTFDTSSQVANTSEEIQLKINGGMTHNDSTFTLTVEAIDKLPINITGVTGTNDAYSGLPQIGYTGSTNTGEFIGMLDHYYKGRNGTSYNSPIAPKDAGDYTVTLSIPEEADYTSTLDIDFSIKKKEILVWPPEYNILQGGELPRDIWINYTGFVGDDNFNNSISQWAEVKLNVKDSNTPGESAISFEKQAKLFPEKEKNYTLKHENGKLIIQKSYMLTVIDSYASFSGAGRYSENFRNVSIDAGTRDGYTFEGWTSSDGVSFEDSKSPTTKITILDKDVTVRANWNEIEKPIYLTVGGVKVTEDNKNKITGNAIHGTVSYDPDTKTLILDNAVIEKGKEGVVGSAISGEGDLTIKLIGNSRLGKKVEKQNDQNQYTISDGIIVHGKITVIGDGNLEIYDWSQGIIAKDIIIDTKGTITIKELGGTKACCLKAEGTLEIKNGTLNLSSYYSNGIYGDNIKISGGTITAESLTPIINESGEHFAFNNAPTFDSSYKHKVFAGINAASAIEIKSPNGATFTKSKYVRIVPDTSDGGSGNNGGSGGGSVGSGSTTPTKPTPVEPKIITPTEIKSGDILAKLGSFLPITDEVKEVKNAKVSILLKEEQKQKMDEKGLTPRLFRFDETKKVWIPVKTRYNNGMVQTTNNVTGTYAVFGVVEPKFSDVKNNAWFNEDLDLAKAYGLINGILNNKGEYEFRGDKTTSRAEFYTMVARLFGAKDDNGFSLYNVLEGKGKGNTGWWTPYQEALESAGFLKDSGDANAPITRLEAMELLTALMKKADNPTTQNANRFTDVDSSIEILTTISGYPDGTLRPNNSLTRAETVTLIIKALEAQGW